LLKEQLSEAREKQRNLDKENRTLRNKVRELESKCTSLTYAPPKVTVSLEITIVASIFLQLTKILGNRTPKVVLYCLKISRVF